MTRLRTLSQSPRPGDRKRAAAQKHAAGLLHAARGGNPPGSRGARAALRRHAALLVAVAALDGGEHSPDRGKEKT